MAQTTVRPQRAGRGSRRRRERRRPGGSPPGACVAKGRGCATLRACCEGRGRRGDPLGRVSNWELADGELAREIAAVNLVGLRSLLVALVVSSLGRKARSDTLPPMPGEEALCALHRAATVFLLKRPGAYRRSNVKLLQEGGGVLRPPPWREVPGLMAAFFAELERKWTEGDPLDVAAYALWRITWIHPFRDGNGRTAFAFAYGCLCLKLGALLPQAATVLDQMLADPAQCNGPLGAADRSVQGDADRPPDLTSLKLYYDELLLRQIRAAEAATP